MKYTLNTDFSSLNGPKAANWIMDFQDMAADAFADRSSHSRLLGNLLILESYVHTLRQSLSDRGRTVSDVCQEALDILWDYLEGKKAASDFQDFANNLYAATLNYNVGEEITDAQAEFYEKHVDIPWGSACEWQILTWLSVLLEDELADACEAGDEEGKRKAVAAYQKYWKKRNIPLIHAPLNIHKLEHEPRFNHAPDAYGLFLVIHAIREWEEMSWHEHADDRNCLFSDFFPGEFSEEHFQKIADRIKDDFKPLSDHPELTGLGDFPLQMAYVHKNQDALLILGQEPVCFMLLTKTAVGSDLLEKVQEQTGLAFHVGF